MKLTTSVLAIAAFALGGLVSAYALLPGKSDQANPPAMRHPVWQEVAWPFPLDEWGNGKAFQCKAADCGTELNVYIRAKIGFCNCATGVSDDEELDRISDFALFGNRLAPEGPGRQVSVAWMKGRSRSFNVGGAPQGALSIGLNDHCDAIVATAVVQRAAPAAYEPAIVEFLGSQTVVRWAQLTLGL